MGPDTEGAGPGLSSGRGADMRGRSLETKGWSLNIEGAGPGMKWAGLLAVVGRGAGPNRMGAWSVDKWAGLLCPGAGLRAEPTNQTEGKAPWKC